MYIGELRSLIVVSSPTGGHQFVQVLGAISRSGQIDFQFSAMIDVLQIIDDRFVRQFGERLTFGRGQNFPQRHAERPNVGFRRKFAQQNTFPLSMTTTLQKSC